jgi:ubiquitin-protein ligase
MSNTRIDNSLPKNAKPPTAVTVQNTLTSSEDSEETRELQIILEYRSLRAFAPSGVYVIPTIQDLYKWYGLLFIRGGEYQGAIFKFRLEIPKDYPCSPPAVFFLSHVFHPLVCPETGQLNLSPRFQTWTPKKDFIFMVLSHIKVCFHSYENWKDLKYVKNTNASTLFETDELQFIREVKTCIMASLDDLQDNNDDFPIRLKSFNTFHKKVLDEIKRPDRGSTPPEQSEAFMRWFKNTFI